MTQRAISRLVETAKYCPHFKKGNSWFYESWSSHSHYCDECAYAYALKSEWGVEGAGIMFAPILFPIEDEEAPLTCDLARINSLAPLVLPTKIPRSVGSILLFPSNGFDIARSIAQSRMNLYGFIPALFYLDKDAIFFGTAFSLWINAPIVRLGTATVKDLIEAEMLMPELKELAEPLIKTLKQVAIIERMR